MSVDFPKKDKYSMDDFLKIVKILRSPGGCPWDREQTHDSIRNNFIEETYEAVEAIDTKNKDDLKEELGDVLLQIALHAEMEDEIGSFSFDDIVDGICKKLIIRHPHVFADVEASDAKQALQNWDAIKRATKKTENQADLLRHLPKSLPTLYRACKVQERAKRVGFDWDDVSGAWNALESEVEELKAATQKQDQNSIDEELGDVLFSVVNVSRFLQVDPDKALSDSTEKFVRRFAAVEQLARERGINMIESTIEELDELWKEVKKHE